jgi:flavin-dependent dehydrogenase
MRRVETVVVGGGPAGTAVACGLATAGREVVLLERTGAPHHKVCGEFLSIETQVHLLQLGIDAAALGAAPVGQVTIHSSTRSVSTALPFRGLSLSRYRLDAALLDAARQSGAEVRCGVAVRTVAPAGDAWTVQCDDGEVLHCRHLVLATGKTGVRGIADARAGAMVGLKMHLRPTQEVRRALEGRVELFFLDRSYIGLELVEDGIANLCCLLPRETVARLGSGWAGLREHLVAQMPALAERLDGAAPVWDRPLAVVCPAGGYLHRAQGEEAGEAAAVYRVGDRFAHIPPFTGDGLAVALTTAALAVGHILEGRPPEAYAGAAWRVTGTAVRLAGIMSALAGARLGRNVLIRAAGWAPSLVGNIARRTRMPLSAKGFCPEAAERLANAGSRR